MTWRESSAAYETKTMGIWWWLPRWWREWIIATVETKTDLHNAMVESPPSPPSSEPSSRPRRKISRRRRKR